MSVKVSFDPDCDRQLAGLVFIYDTAHWHYLYITNKCGKKVCRVLSCDKGSLVYNDNEITLFSEWTYLTAKLQKGRLAFFADGRLVLDNIDASILSDEYIHPFFYYQTES